ncbi:MAG: hypothetical protein KAJ92_05915 [Gammaproteobacteria bacterium]|nr:hypothetical protein [Gammaproteobacteria bacterium]MCK5263201.1 hypothetical protein [Gammaproteobacteria bacterium]
MLDIGNSKYLDDCYAVLEQKQAALIEQYQIDSFDMFDFDMLKGTIEFKQGSTVMVKADFIPVGSFNEDQETWMWAWANGGVTGEILQKAESIRVLDAKTNNDVFNTETVSADEGLAWEIAAMACDYYQGQGVFAAPVEGLLIFMVLNDIECV